jgi:3D (Asp-Asp-Asp) domain-containing protein
MNKNDKASISLVKIIAISIVLIFLTSIGVMASSAKLTNVKIVLSSDYEMTVLTTKTKVADILKENHIEILEDEIVVPDLDSEITNNKTIKISKIDNIDTEVAEVEESITAEQILANYESVTEKIVKEQVIIPFETITKEATGDGLKQNKIVQNGVDGIKEVTYKVKYQNEVEIERTEISSVVIKEPVNKIVEVKTIQVTSRSSTDRTATTNPALTAQTTLAKSVEGITPTIKTFNTSAYCSCSKCCGKSTGITASGAKATAWYTLAAGNGYKIGTVIYIPAFADKPNGGWFIVQDRGGAISNSKLDVYMSSHSEALQFGRKTLECYVYEF